MKSAEEWTAEQFELIPDNVPEELFKKVVRAIQANALRHAAEIIGDDNNPFAREDILAEAQKLEEGKQ